MFKGLNQPRLFVGKGEGSSEERAGVIQGYGSLLWEESSHFMGTILVSPLNATVIPHNRSWEDHVYDSESALVAGISSSRVWWFPFRQVFSHVPCLEKMTAFARQRWGINCQQYTAVLYSFLLAEPLTTDN